jgi:phospholipase/carboxylesterase
LSIEVKQGKSIEASLQHLVFYPSEAAVRYPTVVALHGRGSDFTDLPPLIEALSLEKVLVLAPRAPLRYAGGGYAWYELQGEGNPSSESFGPNLDLLRRFLVEIKDGYPVDIRRVILLGFSQGAVMAYAAGLMAYPAVSGIVALSGYIPTKTGFTLGSKDLSRLRAFVSHGTYDEVIPVHFGREAAELLRDKQADVLYREYAMGHQVIGETIADLTEWMRPLAT